LLNFQDPSLKIKAKMNALGGLVGIQGFGGSEFATLTANSNLDVAAQGRAVARLPNDLPTFLSWANGKELQSASAAFEFSNDGRSSNDFVAYWGEVSLPFDNKLIAGLQVFFAPKFPTLIRSTGQVNAITGGGEGEVVDEQTFAVAADEPFALFSTAWENESATVEIELVDPGGNTISEADIANNAQIEIVTSSTTHRSVIVNAPAAGNWTVRIVDADTAALGSREFATQLEEVPSTIEITNLELDGTQENLTIDFETTEADSEAAVSLFLDTDQEGLDGVLLASELPLLADGSGSTTVDITGLNLGGGEYFVFARLDDPSKPPVLSDYTDVGFKVTAASALPQVTNVAASWRGGTRLHVDWDAVEDADSYLVSLARIIHQCWATSRKSFSSREVQRSYLEHRAEAGNY
jgi:hypothetical protein